MQLMPLNMHPISLADTRDFLTAVKDGDLEKTKGILNRNVNILFETISYREFVLGGIFNPLGAKMNALHVAKAGNNLPMMKLLLSYKEAARIVNEIAVNGLSPLHSYQDFHKNSDAYFSEQESHNQIEIVKLLLKNGADISRVVERGGSLGADRSSLQARTYPLVCSYTEEPECLTILINSVKAKSKEVFNLVLLSNLPSALISIVFSYHVPVEVDRFVNERPMNVLPNVTYETALASIFSDLLGNIWKEPTSTDLKQIKCAQILIDHGADLLDRCKFRNRTILEEIRDLTVTKPRIAKYFQESYPESVLQEKEVEAVERDQRISQKQKQTGKLEITILMIAAVGFVALQFFKHFKL